MVNTFSSAGMSYIASQNRRNEVRGAGHFQVLTKYTVMETMNMTDTSGACEKLIASVPGEKLPKGICSASRVGGLGSFIVSDAALRRMVARHRTLLVQLKDQLSNHKIEHGISDVVVSRMWQPLFNGEKARSFTRHDTAVTGTHLKPVEKASLLQMFEHGSTSALESDWTQWAGLR